MLKKTAKAGTPYGHGVQPDHPPPPALPAAYNSKKGTKAVMSPAPQPQACPERSRRDHLFLSAHAQDGKVWAAQLGLCQSRRARPASPPINYTPQALSFQLY
jgi:hypothetical protein